MANHSTELAGERGARGRHDQSRAPLQWLKLTTIASAFFIIAPSIADPGSGNYPPLLVAILFPAIAIGLAFSFQYLIRRR